MGFCADGASTVEVACDDEDGGEDGEGDVDGGGASECEEPGEVADGVCFISGD